MTSLLIQLDDSTAKKLERIAPARQRKRADFIREAVKSAIRNHEYARMREAYRLQLAKNQPPATPSLAVETYSRPPDRIV